MYIDLCKHNSVYILYIFIYLYIYKYVYIFVYTYICIHIYVYIFLYTYVCIHIYVYMRARVCVCVCAHMLTYIPLDTRSDTTYPVIPWLVPVSIHVVFPEAALEVNDSTNSWILVQCCGGAQRVSLAIARVLHLEVHVAYAGSCLLICSYISFIMFLRVDAGPANKNRKKTQE